MGCDELRWDASTKLNTIYNHYYSYIFMRDCQVENGREKSHISLHRENDDDAKKFSYESPYSARWKIDKMRRWRCKNKTTSTDDDERTNEELEKPVAAATAPSIFISHSTSWHIVITSDSFVLLNDFVGCRMRHEYHYLLLNLVCGARTSVSDSFVRATLFSFTFGI